MSRLGRGRWPCAAGVALALALLRPAAAVKVTPVQQVLNMLGEMKQKGTAAMKVEETTMKAYLVWSDDRIKDLELEIKIATSSLEQLDAVIAKSTAHISSLTNEIAELDGEIAGMEGDLKAAGEKRATEHAEYFKTSTDLADSVDALERAIQTVKAEAYDRPQSMMLLQKMAKKVQGMRRVLGALSLERASGSGAPAIAGYEFQSGGIVEMLEKLLDKFKHELDDTDTAEANAAHAFDMESLETNGMIQQLKSDREDRSMIKGKTQTELAAAQGQKAQTEADLAEDKKLLADTKATLVTKQKGFDTNQKVRAEELEALSKAIEIISDPTVAEAYGAHVNAASSALQQPVAPSFLQERLRRRSPAQNRVAEYLQSKAKAINSRVLSDAAAKVAANPFAKVIQMIEGLLARLKEEAAAEAEHKAYCDKELHDNKLRRNEETSAVDRLTAEVAQLGIEISDTGARIATLSEEQAALAKAMADATEARTTEKAENEAAISDSQEAQKAVKQAVIVLKEFYSAQEAFLQESARNQTEAEGDRPVGGQRYKDCYMRCKKMYAPRLPDRGCMKTCADMYVHGASALQERKQVPEMAAYKGMQGRNGGVIGMLEVIQSDFARVELETTSSETQAANQYATFMEDSKAAKKEKHDLEFQLTLEKDQLEFEQGRVKDDLAGHQKELDSANDYYDSLKPMCVQVHVSYEERVAQRKEEIAALNEAWKVLDDSSPDAYLSRFGGPIR